MKFYVSTSITYVLKYNFLCMHMEMARIIETNLENVMENEL
jgi:hypothetical protein